MTSPACQSTGATVAQMVQNCDEVYNHITDTDIYDKGDVPMVFDAYSPGLTSHFTGTAQGSPSSSPQAVRSTI